MENASPPTIAYPSGRRLIDPAPNPNAIGRVAITVATEEVCQYLTETLSVPVISLGAGNKAHGVHIITSDLFHLYEEHTPRHSKIYTDLIPIIEDVYTRYRDEVRTHVYPGPEHTVYMDEVELATFAKDMQWDSKLEELEKKRA